MKALVFLLVLANLLFYAFGAGYFGRPDNPDAGRVEQQVAPERMRIVSRGEAPGAPPVKPEQAAPNGAPATETPAPGSAEGDKPVATEKASEAKVGSAQVAGVAEGAEKQPVCLTWRPLPLADADRLSALLAKRRVPETRGFEKLVRFLMGKGFSYHIAADAVKARLDAEREECAV